jgi:hypothetical protein
MKYCTLPSNTRQREIRWAGTILAVSNFMLLNWEKTRGTNQ